MGGEKEEIPRMQKKYPKGEQGVTRWEGQSTPKTEENIVCFPTLGFGVSWSHAALFFSWLKT